MAHAIAAVAAAAVASEVRRRCCEAVALCFDAITMPAMAYGLGKPC